MNISSERDWSREGRKLLSCSVLFPIDITQEHRCVIVHVLKLPFRRRCCWCVSCDIFCEEKLVSFFRNFSSKLILCIVFFSDFFKAESFFCVFAKPFLKTGIIE